MKNHYFFSLVFLFFIGTKINAQTTTLNDINFEQALANSGIDIGTPDDNQVPTANIETVTTLNISGLDITDLTGIEDFAALTKLFCSSNNLTSLDLSNNTALTMIDCSNNPLLESLNVKNGNNHSFTFFNALNNPTLTCIDVDNIEQILDQCSSFKDDTASYSLYCAYNDLTAIPDDNFEQALIDLGIDPSPYRDDFVPTVLIQGIEILDVSSRGIEDLTGIEDFTALENLNCSSNGLTSLDVSNNLELEILECSSNSIIHLDLSANEELTSILCNDNDLESLNLQNGNSDAIDRDDFNSTDNSDLTCIQVDAEDVSTLDGRWRNRDDETSIRRECDPDSLTRVPDRVFQAFLVDQGIDSDEDDNDGLVNTADIIGITELDLSVLTGAKIEDLTGIEDFAALTILDVSDHDLTRLDVSDNSNLTTLNVSENGTLSELILGENTNLETIKARECNLTNLDVTNNTGLESLDCFNNKITHLDLSKNTNLINLDCNTNPLQSLDIKNGNNSNMESFDATANPSLECIQVDGVNGRIPILRLFNPYAKGVWVNKDSRAQYSVDCNYTDDSLETATTNSITEQEVFVNTNYGDTSTLNDYELYPNPVTNILNITSSQQIDAINVINIQGFTVLTTTETKINFSHLPQGIYQLNIISGEHTTHKKIIKK